MWFTFSGFLLLLSLAVAVLPVPRVRRLLLTATARLGQAVVLAFLGACGTFFVQPHLAPVWLVAVVSPLIEGIHTVAPNVGTLSAGPTWLLLGVSAVLVALPVLIVLELAVSLSRQMSLVQALRKELRLVAAWVDSRLFGLGLSHSHPPVSHEAEAAVEVFRTATSAKASPNGAHVLDLMK